MKREQTIPVALVVYGIGEVRPDCDSWARRQVLIGAMEQLLLPQGLRLWDADGVLSAAEPKHLLLSRYHGFGSKRGVGHLNHAGHRAYSQLLRQVVGELKVTGN